MKNVTAKVVTTFMLLAVSMQMCHGSAIPIWEFLTRNEKMNYLYSSFAQLVSIHCKATAATTAEPVNHCKRNLLSYGYEKLQTFSDTQLDQLDPYQRGANELIWSSIMQNHASATLITTRKPTLPTPPASSIIILTHQQPAAAASKHESAAAAATQAYARNPIFDAEQHAQKSTYNYAMDMDASYDAYPNAQQELPKTYLTAPLVFRVRTDGSPVEEDQYKPLPVDDDLEAFQLASASSSLPSLHYGNEFNSKTTPASSIAPRANKHRKIATISALKEQRLATLALQQNLQPPYEQPLRTRRQFEQNYAYFNQPIQFAPSAGYHYGRAHS